jgi:hypothetical protein
MLPVPADVMLFMDVLTLGEHVSGMPDMGGSDVVEVVGRRWD